jgi:hypothetical protein
VAHPWKPFVDAREVAQFIVAEPFTVLGGVALLQEAPEDPSDPQYPMTVLVNGSPRARVLGTPAPGQYRVRVWSTSPVGPEWKPELEFNATDEGLTGVCTYYGSGTIPTKLRMEAWQAFLGPLVGVADQATLSVIAPPSADPNQPGRDGRTARLADGSWWESDGVVWKPWVGGGKLSGAQVAPASIGTSQDAAYTPPGAPQSGDAPVLSTLGVSGDALFDQPAAVSEGSTLGTTQDGTFSAASGGSDAFTDADGTLLSSHTPTDGGGAWAKPTGYPSSFTNNAKIKTNRVYTDNTAGQGSIYYKNDTPASADYYVQADVYVVTVGTDYWQAGLVGRLNAASESFYVVRFSQQAANVHRWELYKDVGGTFTALGTPFDETLVAGDTRTVKLAFSGSSITVYVNGVSRITASDSAISAAGKPGIWVYSNTTTVDPTTHGLHLDNFQWS